MVSLVFARPSFLWFLIAIPLLVFIHFVTLKAITRKAVKFANFEAISRVTGNQVLSKNFTLLFMRLIIFLLVILSVAGTTIWYSGQGTNFDFVLAIDSSNSMLVQDFNPNRLEAAKLAANNFIDVVSSNNKIGLVSFTGISTVEHDLSNDFTSIKEKIDSIKVKQLGGTDIGGAIITSTNLLLKTDNPRVIILLTDGQGNIGPEIADAIKYAADNGVVINTIGIGTREGGQLLGLNTTAYNNITSAILKLDEKSLIDIAAATDGKYYSAKDQSSLNDAYKEIAKLTETRISKNLTLSFLVIAIILLLIEWSLINTKYRTIP